MRFLDLLRPSPPAPDPVSLWPILARPRDATLIAAGENPDYSEYDAHIEARLFVWNLRRHLARVLA